MRLVALRIPCLMRILTPQEVEPSHKEDEGLYIPSYPEEAIPDDPVLQVRVACALRGQEMNSKRCFTCNRSGHLTRDHQEWKEKNGIRPLQLKGPPSNSWSQRRPSKSPLSPVSRGLPQSRESTLFEPRCFF